MFFESLRSGFAHLIRELPRFRGRGSLCAHANDVFLKLGLEPVVLARMTDDTIMRLDTRCHTEFLAYYTGQYDKALLDCVLALFDHDATFLDIGANVGFYAVAVAHAVRKTGGRGRVMAFEPFHDNFSRLKENIELNGLVDLAVLVETALPNTAGRQLIVLREDFSRGSTTGNASIVIDEDFDKDFPAVPIDMDRLDNLWQTLDARADKIDFVKIDIEGHEDFCLQGAWQTFCEHRPTLLMEVNKPYYRARGVCVNDVLTANIPPEYVFYRNLADRWTTIRNFDECNPVDNVLLIPREKILMDKYRKFTG
ncbi:FkbM family methyltransferase [Methylococcus capsulatus]|uniref:FkbM family methyltransferase n=1 Tax=Methylococcus capsulatus TaxID=414 RepID=UPI001C531DDF|nr:FkbM family methyltransferase [Methylococcus capsulatus]QXP88115.1 FkbM family methyltransferase [Methylococcus capsulatus]QXP90529.1 FkbM family methyltransferase [Methylococcus capsulatus]